MIISKPKEVDHAAPLRNIMSAKQLRNFSQVRDHLVRESAPSAASKTANFQLGVLRKSPRRETNLLLQLFCLQRFVGFVSRYTASRVWERIVDSACQQRRLRKHKPNRQFRLVVRRPPGHCLIHSQPWLTVRPVKMDCICCGAIFVTPYAVET